MALRLERIAGAAQIVRVYEAAQPAPMAPYIASFVLEWPLDGDQRSVWIKAMQGRMPPSALRELALLLIEKGVRFVLAKRAEGHVLPLGVLGEDDITRIDLWRVAARMARQGAEVAGDADPA